MDLDAFITVHGASWKRLDALARKRRLTDLEIDELVVLYQRTATHLSVVRSQAPDPALVTKLSSTVARARSAVTGGHEPAWREIGRFFAQSFPAAVYRARWASIATGVITVLIATVVAVWMLHDPRVEVTLASASDLERYVNHDFQNYYSDYNSASFSLKVWTNNAFVAALCIAFGITGVIVAQVIWNNALNLGIAAGLMIGHGHGALFFGLILPHGLLELTAVFVAAGAGLRLFWAWIDPGRRSRSQALAVEGRAMVTIAVGLVVVLAVSGAIEGFVTPSPLPTWARIGIGVVAWAAFVAYVWVFGGRAVRAGETGDLDAVLAGDLAPVVG